MTLPVPPIPAGHASLTPYLILHDCGAGLAWYQEVFGAVPILRMDMPDGKVGHAELEIGNSRIMLADEFAGIGARSPKVFGGSPMSLVLYVEDADTVVARALAAGAVLVRPVEDKFYGDRMGTVEDPFGFQWSVATHFEDVDPAELDRRARTGQA